MDNALKMRINVTREKCFHDEKNVARIIFQLQVLFVTFLLFVTEDGILEVGGTFDPSSYV